MLGSSDFHRSRPGRALDRRRLHGRRFVTGARDRALFGSRRAVLDRVLHHSHVLVIQGDSFRLKQKKRAAILDSTKNHSAPG